MNRKEEIFSAATSFANAVCSGIQDSYFDMTLKIYQVGAEWSDENPREGLVDIEKVKEFLSSVDLNFYREWEDKFNTDELIVDLEKYLEE